LDIHFTIGTSYKIAAPLAKKNAAYQTSQYVVLHSGIFLGKWRSSFAGSSNSKINVQSACALNTQYVLLIIEENLVLSSQLLHSNLL
jgi:hypothetical protein